jgi:capsule polysaccharide export protein KpsE/RkpR
MAYYPGERVKATNPSRFSVAKVIVVLVVLVVLYFGFTFAPPYWRYYQASEVMAKQANAAWSQRRGKEQWSDTSRRIHHLVSEGLTSHLQLNDSERQLQVEVDKVDDEIRVKATWTAYAEWPLLAKRTPLKFTEEFVRLAR